MPVGASSLSFSAPSPFHGASCAFAAGTKFPTRAKFFTLPSKTEGYFPLSSFLSSFLLVKSVLLLISLTGVAVCYNSHQFIFGYNNLSEGQTSKSWGGGWGERGEELNSPSRRKNGQVPPPFPGFPSTLIG